MSSVSRYSDLLGTELVAESTYTFDGVSCLTDLVHQQNATTLAEFNLVYDARAIALRALPLLKCDSGSSYNDKWSAN